jgi:hypothetical protein
LTCSWYAAAVHAAEHAHRSFPGRRATPSLAAALRRPLEAWLSPRLDDVGFQTRAFPQLLPLDLLLELGGGGASGSEDGGAAGFCTTHAFARWARSADGELPLLASQFHDVDRCTAVHKAAFPLATPVLHGRGAASGRALLLQGL